MFKGDGAQRSVRQNAALAGPLAIVAGMVNALGFLTLGIFTSHVTGHAGKLSTEFAAGQTLEAWNSAWCMFAFFGGAFVASLTIESRMVASKPYAYSGLLFLEAALLVSFLFESPDGALRTARVLNLCFAMGIQNGLVTRLSGAVVRTTHLTGIVTDLGIEAARWLQLGLARLRRSWESSREQSLASTHLPKAANGPAPSLPRVQLLLTILVGFIAGGVLGAKAFVSFGPTAFVGPVLLLIAGGGLAFKNGMDTLGPASRQ